MKVDENKIAYCKKLYLEQHGKDHKLIEKSMREVGYSFSTRSLYCSKGRPGWIDKYGFRQSLNSDKGQGMRKCSASSLVPLNLSLNKNGS